MTSRRVLVLGPMLLLAYGITLILSAPSAPIPPPAPVPAPEFCIDADAHYYIPEVMPQLEEPEALEVRDEVRKILTDLGREDDYECLSFLFARESSWRPDAIGDNGDSFGLGQRNAPAHGAPPWPWPVLAQVLWFLEYADDRYGGPCAAADVWRDRAAARGGAGWW